jgi:CheY-like chemotaxis protein
MTTLTAATTTTILLVDDVAFHLETEQTFLRRRDVEVLTSGQGPQLLALARENRPDVAVLDLRTPDGIRLCRSLKTDRVTETIPVIAVASRLGEYEAMSAGADILIFEPISRAEMHDALRGFVHFPQRREPRCNASLLFSIAYDNHIGQAFSRDLSSYGTFLRTEWTPPEGAEINLRFSLPGEGREIGCLGVVRSLDRSDRAVHSGFGVEFRGMAATDRARLEEFIRRQLR